MKYLLNRTIKCLLVNNDEENRKELNVKVNNQQIKQINEFTTNQTNKRVYNKSNK